MRYCRAIVEVDFDAVLELGERDAALLVVTFEVLDGVKVWVLDAWAYDVVLGFDGGPEHDERSEDCFVALDAVERYQTGPHPSLTA